MSHKKRLVSKILQIAAARVAGIESIDPLPDMGTAVSVPIMKTMITEGQTALNTYNALLAEADEAKNNFEKIEAKAKDCASRILAGIGAKFGRDSNEYEMAGGRRTSDRRRRSAPRTTPTTPTGA